MAIYVYVASTGALYSYSPDDTSPVASAEVLTANGFALLTGQPPLDDTHVWDATTKTVVTIAAPIVPNVLPTWQYIAAFTPAESAAIRANSDAAVQHMLYMLQFTQNVDLNSAQIQQGVGYLVSLGLLTQERGAAILATVAS